MSKVHQIRYLAVSAPGWMRDFSVEFAAIIPSVAKKQASSTEALRLIFQGKMPVFMNLGT